MQQVQDGARKCASLASSQVLLLLLAQEPHFEKNSVKWCGAQLWSDHEDRLTVASEQFLGWLRWVGALDAVLRELQEQRPWPETQKAEQHRRPSEASAGGFPSWQSYAPHLKKKLRRLKPSI